MTFTQFTEAKSLILDLLGYGVTPEFLAEVPVNKRLLVYCLRELNLRLPSNIKLDDIVPYDPPDQASYTSGKGTNGWAAYKVAENVTSHEAWGLGIYSVFRRPNVNLSRAIEVPNEPGVRFHHMITVQLANQGVTQNVINDAGGPTGVNPRVTPKVTDYPAK